MELQWETISSPPSMHRSKVPNCWLIKTDYVTNNFSTEYQTATLPLLTQSRVFFMPDTDHTWDMLNLLTGES